MQAKALLFSGLLLPALAPLTAAAQSSFSPFVSYAASTSLSFGVAIGDVNGDGRPDLVQGSSSGGAVSVLLNSATAPGTFGPATTYSAYGTAGSFATAGVMLGDVNGDSRLDIVTVNNAGTSTGNGTVSVLLNSATAPGTFGPASLYPTGGSGFFGVLADLNGDGRLDIGVANSYSNSGGSGGNTVGVLLNLAAAPGTFGAAALYPCGGLAPIGLAVGDVNGDGRPDLATGNLSSNSVSVLLNQASAPGTFGSVATYTSGGSQPVGVVLADVNRDGRVDLAVANLSSGNVGVLLNQASAPGTLAPVVTYSTGGNTPNLLAVGDVNGDNRLDLVTGNQDSNNVGVLTGKATLGTFAATTYPCGSGPIGVAVADLNGDGRPDIAASQYGGSGVSVLLNNYQYLAATPATTSPDFALYPNPAHGSCTLTLPAGLAGSAQVELLNTLGQVALRQATVLPTGATQLALDATGLPAGAYTLRLLAGTQVLVRRVLVR